MSGTSRYSALRQKLWPRRSELMRRADWIEAALLLAAITVALVLMPVALAVGSETYVSQARVGQEQNRVRHPVTATLLHDAPPLSAGTEGVVVGVSEVPARWTLPDGSERTGGVPASSGAKAGTPVPIWLGEAGTPAPAPVTGQQAALAGIAVAMGGWIATAATLCVIFLLARADLNRRRSAAWQRDWARVEPDWTRRT